MDQPQPSHRTLSCMGAMVLIALIFSLLAGFIYYRVETLPSRSAQQIRDIFGEVAHLQPQISIRDRVLFEQTNSMLELAVVSKDTHVEREIEHQWFGSTKKLRLFGTYRVRAGFDLTKPFRVRIEGRRVIAELPPPRILSVAQVSVEVTDFDNGLWNKFDPKEVIEEESAMPLLARQKASEAGLQKEALDRFTQALRSKLGSDYDLEVRSVAPALQRSPTPPPEKL